ncbi:nucleoside-diphosphate kinase [Alkalibacter rhizosphaerae]|uniref:Nucleoside diphosphate kinase n=1 Tax=Alkalibacter rhizosphaerae TaxID=2815577 RepID=A0A975AIP1_9FIRM|nr:nucleoside-diphosphate kinase [Alkalibacter rhizosphaerae]QSX08874.1 nucleoside-diphosphate kinase [Alkalibacter rhizosphaerae]
MAVEKTLVILKPDAMERGIVGEIISMIEKKTFKITYMAIKNLTDEDLEYHYAEHKDKPFFPSLASYMKRGPVVVMVVEGENAIKGFRKLTGATDPMEADNGSIRGRFALTKDENIVHASDSPESAQRESDFFVKNIKA